jgi:hypothetical protein
VVAADADGAPAARDGAADVLFDVGGGGGGVVGDDGDIAGVGDLEGVEGSGE